MASLISMCTHDTVENGRSQYTLRTLNSLYATVDFTKHRLIVFDNGSCEETKEILRQFSTITLNGNKNVIILTSKENIGTARGINECWKLRRPGENCIKLDNDVEFHSNIWVEELEEAIAREPRIGIAALKRKDLTESPNNPSPHFKSELIMLAQELGQRWIVVEKVKSVFGTCQMYSAAFLEQMGYLIQVGPYGWDDVLSAVRCEVAGKWGVFLPHIEIDHIDTGGTDYTQWKVEQAGIAGPAVQKLINDYQTGIKPIYYDGGFGTTEEEGVHRY